MLISLVVLAVIIVAYTGLWWFHKKPLSKIPPDGTSVLGDYLRRSSVPDNEFHYNIKHVQGPNSGSDIESLLTRHEVEAKFEASSWQRLAYEDFKTTILAKGAGLKTFPCIYATMGYRSNDHRYLFLESDNPSEPRNIRLIGPALQEYLTKARSLGPNTSLVIMGAPSTRSKSVEQYNGHFWDMLRGLRIYDTRPWPQEVPSKTESEKWTFCYNGEPVFPVMLTPSHSRRYSRHMSVPVIALQPKWVLDQLLATPEKRESAIGKVRKLLREYDSIGISSDLTTYGDPGTSESRQLCLSDEDLSIECPYEDLDR